MSESALIDRLRPGDHVSWIIEDDADHRRLLDAYVRAAVLADHKTLLFVDVTPPEAALDVLAATGLDVDRLVGSGQLEVRGAVETYLGDDGLFDGDDLIDQCVAAAQQARTQGYSGLRMLGDTNWLDPSTGGDFVAYEEKINRIFLDGFLIGTCVYDRRHIDRDLLASATGAHPGTVDGTYDVRLDDGTWAPLLRFRRIEGGLRLEGEVDVSNHGTVVALLDALSPPGSGRPAAPLRLDVERLAFLDVATACHLVDVAARAGGLRLIGAAPQLVRLLTAVGASRAGGLVIEED